MPQSELFAFAHLVGTGFVPAGRLELTEAGSAVQASSFAYGSRYLERSGAIEVDPVSLPLDDPFSVHLGSLERSQRFQHLGITIGEPNRRGLHVRQHRPLEVR